MRAAYGLGLRSLLHRREQIRNLRAIVKAFHAVREDERAVSVDHKVPAELALVRHAAEPWLTAEEHAEGGPIQPWPEQYP